QKKLVEKLGDDAKTIKVAIVENKVVLVGEVQGRDTQELAEEVALSVPGVTKVDNQIKTPAEKSLFGGKVKDESADNSLEGAVDKALKKELGGHFKNLKVEAVAGSVLVRGTLPDEARLKIARETAKGVPGVKRVIDLLEVEKK
ncbi:MAG: BON domain-containing protein, partial [Acidithiobacillales bacterium]